MQPEIADTLKQGWPHQNQRKQVEKTKLLNIRPLFFINKVFGCVHSVVPDASVIGVPSRDRCWRHSADRCSTGENLLETIRHCKHVRRRVTSHTRQSRMLETSVKPCMNCSWQQQTQVEISKPSSRKTAARSKFVRTTVWGHFSSQFRGERGHSGLKVETWSHDRCTNVPSLSCLRRLAQTTPRMVTADART